MSDETQGNPLFAPFMPPNEQTMPFTPAPATPPIKVKKERKPKVAKPPKVAKAPRKPAAKVPTPKPAATEPRSVLDLQTILRATGGLKDEDYDAFEKLLNTFDKMSKPQGTRILTALGKVFA